MPYIYLIGFFKSIISNAPVNNFGNGCLKLFALALHTGVQWTLSAFQQCDHIMLAKIQKCKRHFLMLLFFISYEIQKTDPIHFVRFCEGDACAGVDIIYSDLPNTEISFLKFFFC